MNILFRLFESSYNFSIIPIVLGFGFCVLDHLAVLDASCFQGVTLPHPPRLLFVTLCFELIKYLLMFLLSSCQTF